MSTKRKDWKKLLKEQEIKDNAEIITELTDKMNSKTIIEYICICGEKNKKTNNSIINHSGFFL